MEFRVVGLGLYGRLGPKVLELRDSGVSRHFDARIRSGRGYCRRLELDPSSSEDGKIL